jgi:hypothetical protein
MATSNVSLESKKKSEENTKILSEVGDSSLLNNVENVTNDCSVGDKPLPDVDIRKAHSGGTMDPSSSEDHIRCDGMVFKHSGAEDGEDGVMCNSVVDASFEDSHDSSDIRDETDGSVIARFTIWVSIYKPQYIVSNESIRI